MQHQSKPNGYVLWESAHVVAIITGLTRKSANIKTGSMAQTWILVKAENPVAAVESKQDALVCGNCPLRGSRCYVNKGQAPFSVWRAWISGAYPAVDWHALKETLAGRTVRFGSYGDPAVVPFYVWDRLAGMARGWTGYTHQWRRPEAAGYKALLMASVDSHAEQFEATRAGWRTFRVQKPGQLVLVDEITCPASDEGGRRVTCEQCRLCCGTARTARNIVINAHGNGKNLIED